MNDRNVEMGSVDMATTPGAIVCLEPDLFVATRLADVIQACGGQSIIIDTPEAMLAAVDAAFPVLILVDLNTPGDWGTAISRCKLRPQTRNIPLIAFGSHVDVETLKAARRAGADHAWARSKMMEELVQVVKRHLVPPVTYLDGWDAPLSQLAHAGVEAFNRGDYFLQHEEFEAAWLAEPRPIRVLYQGILQIGLAFLQIQRNNWVGAIKMFRRGLPRLRPLPPVVQGLQLAPFYAAAAAIHQEISALGPERLHEFDQSRFPSIEYSLDQ